MTLPYHDLERPYSDACSREERYREIESRVREDLLEELRDEQKAELFAEQVDNIYGLLGYVMSKVSEGILGGEVKKAAAYKAIEMKFEELIDEEAKRRARKIYE